MASQPMRPLREQSPTKTRLQGVKIEVRYTDDNSTLVTKETYTNSEGVFVFTPEDLAAGAGELGGPFG